MLKEIRNFNVTLDNIQITYFVCLFDHQNDLSLYFIIWQSNVIYCLSCTSINFYKLLKLLQLTYITFIIINEIFFPTLEML